MQPRLFGKVVWEDQGGKIFDSANNWSMRGSLGNGLASKTSISHAERDRGRYSIVLQINRASKGVSFR